MKRLHVATRLHEADRYSGPVHTVRLPDTRTDSPLHKSKLGKRARKIAVTHSEFAVRLRPLFVDAIEFTRPLVQLRRYGAFRLNEMRQHALALAIFRCC